MKEDIIKLSPENIDSEHLCCAFSDKKCVNGYEAKRELIKQRFYDGFQFHKLNERAKVFIDFVPAEKAWAPIDAPGYMFIGCFWVSGKYKKNGYGKQLLNICKENSKECKGIVTVVGKKKKTFLSDKKFLLMQGFELCDSTFADFELVVLKFDKNAPDPSFKDCARSGKVPYENGLTVYFSNMCPFTDYYVNTELKRLCLDNDLNFTPIHITTTEEAQECPSPFTIHSIFLNGEFVTQEILSEKSFAKHIVQKL